MKNGSASTARPCTRWLRSAWVLLACCSLGACQTLRPTQDAKSLQEMAAFYWPYAALATNVYDSKGQIEPELSLALASPWLRAAMNSAAKAQGSAPEIGDELDAQAQTAHFRDGFDRQCLRIKRRSEATDDKASAVIRKLCKRLAEADLPRSDDASDGALGDNAHINETPVSVDDCTFKGKKPPSVDINDAIREFKWQRVPEFQKYAVARGWRLFVPELAIDVWRRARPSIAGELDVEYAIVYRGTVGNGGWFTNLRVLSAMAPFVWDQYGQAKDATVAIIKQIYMLHELADSVLKPKRETRIFITTVGHSLGAGLAAYVYLEIPQVTRVVGFDPTPFDGSSLIRVDERNKIMGNAQPRRSSRVELDDDADELPAATLTAPRMLDPRSNARPEHLHMLTEKGEVISRFSRCEPGPVWGGEGGPLVQCDFVDLSGGSWFAQHSMSQLACNLNLVHRRTRAATAP